MIKMIYNDGCSLGAGAEHNSWEMSPDGIENCDSTWTDIIKNKYYPNAKKMTRATTGTSNRGIRRRTIHNILELLETYKSDNILVFIMSNGIFVWETVPTYMIFDDNICFPKSGKKVS